MKSAKLLKIPLGFSKAQRSESVLSKVKEIILSVGYDIENIDSTIVAQAPKMMAHIMNMRSNLAAALDINVDQVNVKATTEEKLGFTGDGSGIAAHAVCLILKKTAD